MSPPVSLLAHTGWWYWWCVTHLRCAVSGRSQLSLVVPFLCAWPCVAQSTTVRERKKRERESERVRVYSISFGLRFCSLLPQRSCNHLQCKWLTGSRTNPFVRLRSDAAEEAGRGQASGKGRCILSTPIMAVGLQGTGLVIGLRKSSVAGMYSGLPARQCDQSDCASTSELYKS